MKIFINANGPDFEGGYFTYIINLLKNLSQIDKKNYYIVRSNGKIHENLSDLNSKIPSVLEPDDIQSVVSGTGGNFGTIEHTQKDFKDGFGNKEIIAYTSGLGGLFKPGIPIGKIKKDSFGKVNFFSDFTQLSYVKIVSYKVGGEK